MYVIGTAGHVDHGKSALVLALTGTDPDRLREEKERGLTIELGFGRLRLPGGGEVSVVDVPGHERFIKTMLAGAGGIDLALLVVAADEGVMPQTREHLAIVDLLGVEHGVVAVTKCDAVEPAMAELAAAEIAEELQGTTLEGAPTVVCSAKTGEGLDALLAALDSELAKTPAKRDIGRPRLPIDRAFTMAGFGTVVTGTLIGGLLAVGQEVEALPDGPRGRIRGLQTHGEKVEVARPGQRTAANLAGVSVEELRRGMVLAAPGSLRPATVLDVRLRAVRYLRRRLRHNSSVTLHTGAGEAPARLVLLDREELTPGEEGWAQLRLVSPLAAAAGDRFVVRDPNDTLGGGTLVDTRARRHRRFHAPTLERLEALFRGSPREAVLTAVAGAGGPASLRDLSAGLDLSEGEAREAARELLAEGALVALDGRGTEDSPLLMSAEGLAELTARALEALGEYHRRHPLRPGMPREELRGRLALDDRAFEGALALWASRGEIAEAGGAVALAGHEPRPDEGQAERAEELLAALRSSPYSPPAPDADDDLLAFLEGRGEIVRANGVAFAAEAYREMVERVVARLEEGRTVTLAEVRDLLGTSRKYAQALLERMDSDGITRRTGDERSLRRTARS